MEKEFNKSQHQMREKDDKERLFDDLKRLTVEVVKDETEFRKYLDFQSLLDKYSVANVILIAGKLDNASRLKTRGDWEEQGIRVLDGMESIQIFEPYEYKTEGGLIKSDYKVKAMFDISQTDAGESHKDKKIPERIILKALIKESPVEIEGVSLMENEVVAEYSHKNQKIYVRRDIEPETFFKAVSKEIAYSHFAQNDYGFNKEKYEFKAECVAYMLCRKYGYEPDIDRCNIPNKMRDMSPKEVRMELFAIKSTFCEIKDHIQESIEYEMRQKKQDDKER